MENGINTSVTGFLLLALGCSGHPDEGTPVKPGTGVEGVPGRGTAALETKARPIMGGTLLVARDGVTAVASDPDRNQIFIADLGSHEVTSIALEANDVPGRIVEAADGTAFVVLRNSAELARLDLSQKKLVGRIAVCNAPRGLAYDANLGQLYVACRAGSLLSLDASTGEQTRQIYVADDLRDVVVSGDKLLVTRFRAAEAIVVDSTGQIAGRSVPPTLTGATSVAWRTQATSQGQVYMTLQSVSTTAPVSIQESGYGSGGFDNCSFSIVTPLVTAAAIDPDGNVNFPSRVQLPGSAGPTDIAVSNSGRVGVVITGNTWADGAQSVVYMDDLPEGESADCGAPGVATKPAGEAVAIAFDGAGRGVVQSREPAALYLEDGAVISLSDESHASTGLALFHMNTGAGIACASCHPEGLEDGQTWNFAEIGDRRTQTVAGGVKSRAPFHWDGDMADFRTLIDEVMVSRMSLEVRPNRLQMGAFETWVDSIERPEPNLGDPEAVARGKALFFDSKVGCNDCHAGPALTNNALVDVGTGGEFVVPTLIGIGAQRPYLHNGCAPTLKDRFGVCGGGDQHGQTSQLSSAELDDLVVYLQTL